MVNPTSSHQQSLFDPSADNGDPIRQSVARAAERLAAALSIRFEEMAEREKRVRLHAEWDTLPNMPARLIWEALEPGAAPFFVVYKLMHEARSVLPKIYRAIAWELCSAQPQRFRLVTYREQLWSLLASGSLWPEDLSELTESDARRFILDTLIERSAGDWWYSREEDCRRDAEWIANRIVGNNQISLGLASLRSLQLSQSNALTAGNVILNIPENLEMLAGQIVSQAREGELPPLNELQNRLAGLAREIAGHRFRQGSINASLPFDLFTLEEDQRIRIVAMTRVKASRAEQEELRRRLIYLRFFAHYAFGEREPEDIVVTAAFYADKKTGHENWLPKKKPLFHPEEFWSFDDFWNYVAGRENGGQLVEEVTQQAAEKLRKQDWVTKLRKFVSEESKEEKKQ
jgi:hypothetical protein